MQEFFLPAIVFLIVFVVFLVITQRMASATQKRKKDLLGQMSEETARSLNTVGSTSVLKEEVVLLPTTGVYGFLASIPGVSSTFSLMLKAGLEKKLSTFLLASGGVFIVLAFILGKMGLGGLGVILALVVTVLLLRMYLQSRINDRNAKFLNSFPDAIDMIVRSVRSGHPLNAALRMIAENMDPPISEEFKQVIDEVSYGRTLPEALARMSSRIDEQDLRFFVVVLSVQQETGGSLSEVLSNLSGIIRKRKQLRMKIRALTSEGRATSYIMGALPVFEFALLYFISPGYLDPLFTTFSGKLVLAAAIGLILGAMWIVRIMVDIEI